MERMTVNQESVDGFRSALQAEYPTCSEPLPGSRLKVDDDVIFLGMFPMKVLWGHEDSAWFHAYSPDYFGEQSIVVEGRYIDDRAPADPNDLPAMPIWEESPAAQQQQQLQQQQQQHQRPGQEKQELKRDLADEQRALQALLAQVPPAKRKEILEKVQKLRPELIRKRG